MLAPPVLPRLLARVLAGTFSLSNVIFLLNKRALQLFSLLHSLSITVSSFFSLSKIPHCCLLKSLGLVSVPMWLIILSNKLKIIGLVVHYTTNYLILHKLIF